MRWRWTATLLATAGLAACGGEDPEPAQGPASLVPSDGVLVYAEANVRPEGDEAAGVRTALGKVTRRDDVLELLVGEVNDALAEDVDLTYEEDIEPWLGERAGIFLTRVDGDSPEGAIVLEVRDEERARAALDKARPGFEDGSEGALVDGQMVIGSRSGVEAARRAAEGSSLADSDRYADALEPLEDDRLAHVWVDVRRALEAAPAEAGVETYQQAVGDVENPSVGVALDVEAERLAIEIGGEPELLSAIGGLAEGERTAASPLLGDLPASSWLAFGVAGAGRTIGQSFMDSLEQSGPAGASVLQEVERRAGVDLRADLLDQLRDLAFHASGTGLTSLGVGVLLEAEDAGRVVDAVRRLVEAFGAGQVAVEPSGDDGFVVRLRAAPFAVQVSREGDRVAAALGADAADALLEPRDPLRDSEVLDEAAGDLGEDANVSGFVRFAPLLELMNGLLGDDPGFQRARPYLEAYDRIVFGDRAEDDVVVSEIAVVLR